MPGPTNHYDKDFLLAMVHGGTMLVGLVLLALSSPVPERVRVEALRSGLGSPRLAFSRSAVWLALALAGVTGLVSLPQFIFSFGRYCVIWALATANLFVFFLMFCLLLEYCRLRFRTRGPGFVALGLFVLCVLPLILARLLSSMALAELSFLTPGVLALLKPDQPDVAHRVVWLLVQLGVCVLLFVAWVGEWKRLLASLRKPR